MRVSNRIVMRALSCAGVLVLLVGLGALVSGCPDKKPKYPTCDSDKDCKDGEHCVDKVCRQCGEDSHCPDGQTCKDGACVAKREGKACAKDADCPSDQTCKEGICSACESNSECGPGGKCNAGKCERAKKCTQDSDCEDDEDCIDGFCQRPWQGTEPEDSTCKLETIYFDYDSTAVTQEARAILSKNAQCVNGAPDRGVYIVGHTDASGTEEYNIALSERRAQVVADYIARLGIDPARMRLIPKGESEPTGKGDGIDRRVEFEWK